MTISVNEAVFGIPPQPERIEALSWAEAFYYRKLHGNNVRLPAHMGHLSLAELQAKADEETRPQREAESYNDSLLRRMIGQLNSRRRRARPAPVAPALAAPAAPDPAAFATALAASLGPVLREELARALETERRRAMSPLVGQAESDPFPV